MLFSLGCEIVMAAFSVFILTTTRTCLPGRSSLIRCGSHLLFIADFRLRARPLSSTHIKQANRICNLKTDLASDPLNEAMPLAVGRVRVSYRRCYGFSLKPTERVDTDRTTTMFDDDTAQRCSVVYSGERVPKGRLRWVNLKASRVKAALILYHWIPIVTVMMAF